MFTKPVPRLFALLIKQTTDKHQVPLASCRSRVAHAASLSLLFFSEGRLVETSRVGEGHGPGVVGKQPRLSRRVRREALDVL